MAILLNGYYVALMQGRIEGTPIDQMLFPSLSTPTARHDPAVVDAVRIDRLFRHQAEPVGRRRRAARNSRPRILSRNVLAYGGLSR